MDDPNADPYEDPSYNYDVKTLEFQKVEGADSAGRVKGEYTYLDDAGERHNVKYESDQGFEVTNAVPDSPQSVEFGLPLYKTDKSARGKIAFEKGPGGQYKFISAGPDQRRSEQTGSDGITRGSYSYLDDEGVQRTVEYIAGPGIGYRIVSTRVGSGSHIPTALPAFGAGGSGAGSGSGSGSQSSKPSAVPTSPTGGSSSGSGSGGGGSGGDYYPTSDTSAFYDPAYTDIEGLKPPNVYNPYEGSYQTYGILSSTASSWSPSFELTPPYEQSFKPTTSTFQSTSSPLLPGSDGFIPSIPLSSSPTAAIPTPGIIASVIPVSSNWRPGMVLNIDLLQPGRAPSPGEALRQEQQQQKLAASQRFQKIQMEKVTNCSRKSNNEFSCTVKEEEKKPRGNVHYRGYRESKLVQNPQKRETDEKTEEKLKSS